MSLYIISDLHFDDQWICDEHRPFKDVNEMNEILISNCKSQIDDEDTFLFLGDLVGNEGTHSDRGDYFHGRMRNDIVSAGSTTSLIRYGGKESQRSLSK